METSINCWCGNNQQIEPFSEDYVRCRACQTLIWIGAGKRPQAESADDEAYYDFDYWLGHQADLGLPDIHTRARTDFVDRIPYWASLIFKYKLPPGKMIDVGSSHGGLVAFLKEADFEAIGLEVSPKLAEYSQETFGVSTLSGYIEDQKNLEAATFDIVTLMDVIEHLENPLETMRHCAALAKEDGLLVIQTPAFPEGLTYSDLKTREHPFLKMMIPREHRYLFSKAALVQLLQLLGFNQIRFEKALFEYDMFCFASKETLAEHSSDQVRLNLITSPGKRSVLAMIELFEEKERWQKLFLQADRDRVERLKANDQLTKTIDRITQETIELRGRIGTLESKVEFLNKQGGLAQKRIKEFEDLIAILQNSSSYKLLTKLKRLSWFDQEARKLMTSPPIPMTREHLLDLRNYKLRLAVDLTPVRPGGENGGAKIMALNLIRYWSETLAPKWEYVLLTSEITHEELAWLDRANVRRECVNFNAGKPQAPAQHKLTLRERLRGIYQRNIPVNIQLRLDTMKKHISEEPQATGVLRRVGADLLFCPFTAPFYHDPDVPIVLVVHDLQFAYYPWFFTPEDIYHTNRYFQQSVEVANRLICVSDYTRNSVLEKSSIRPDRVEVVRSCLFSPILQIEQSQVQQILDHWGLIQDQFVFYPANFWQHKNHQMLILAFNQFIQHNPLSKLKLVFSGEQGPRMDFLRDAVEKFGLEEKVVFLGFVSAEELAAMYQGCKAVIFPSLFEGFGVPVLEGMSYGKPVLCSNVTSLPEVGGEAVLYFDPRKVETIVEAIQRIEADQELVKELGQRGLKRSQEFGTTETWAAAYLDVLCQVYAETRKN